MNKPKEPKISRLCNIRSAPQSVPRVFGIIAGCRAICLPRHSSFFCKQLALFPSLLVAILTF